MPRTKPSTASPPAVSGSLNNLCPHSLTVIVRCKKATNVEYVSLLAVRDWTCYGLRISHEVFEQTLQTQFPLALRKEIPYSIALEVDISIQTLPVSATPVPSLLMAVRVTLFSMRSRTK